MIDEKKLIERINGMEDTCNLFRWRSPNKIKEGLASVILREPKIGGWIPCSERLPEEYGDYLVTFGFNDVSVKTVDVSSYSESGFEFINVIAWQPLPEEYHG